MMLSFVVSYNGQTLKEKLPDGSLIIEYEGIEYRALPPSLMREILKRKTELELTKQEFVEYKDKSEQLVLSIKMAQKKEVEALSADRDFWKDKFYVVDKDRLSYAGKLSKCSGKVLLIRFCWF